MRLQFYGAKVRELTIACGDSASLIAINYIYRHRHRLSSILTPNLSTLVIENQEKATLAEIFMHPKLTTLKFAVPIEPWDRKAMFYNIKRKLSNLTSISIMAEDEGTAELMETEFTRISSSLRKLHSVCIPYLTTSLLKALSRLPNLKEIKVSHCGQGDSFGKDFVVDSGVTFPQLTELDQTGRFEDMLQLVNHAPNLEQLRVLAWKNESAEMYQTLLTSLSKSHPGLNELVIDNIPHSWTFRDEQATEGTGEAFIDSVFSTITAFTRLTILRLTMVFPFRFTKDKVAVLSSSLPNLKVLYLNCCHVILRDDASSASSIHILSNFAKWCPRLTELGLFVDCRNIPLLLYEPEHTLKLTRLNLGVSHIGFYSLHLAHYLSYHCLPHCKFECGSDLWPKGIEERVIAEYGEDYGAKRWDGEREDIERVFRVYCKLGEQSERERKVGKRNGIVRETPGGRRI